MNNVVFHDFGESSLVKNVIMMTCKESKKRLWLQVITFLLHSGFSFHCLNVNEKSIVIYIF